MAGLFDGPVSRGAPAAARPKLLALATAVPENRISQDLVAETARGLFADRREDFDRLEGIFRNAGVGARYSVRPISWFLEPRDWPARTQAYLEGAMALYRRAAEAALRQAGLRADQVDTVVTLSTTGIATPSLEARLKGELGLRDDVRRIPVFGLGCAGGVAGLAIAARLAAAAPEETVLVVTVELCTLAFRLDDPSTRSIVSAALFGDGAAAAVVSCRGEGLAALGPAAEHTWPDTLDIMGWTVDPVGFGVLLSSAVPSFVETELRPVVDGFLARSGLAVRDLASHAFHPGGAKVLQALEAAFELDPAGLAIEREVLSRYGNMSAPTVLFILERALAAGSSGPGLAAALGPGFSANLLLYET